MNTTTDDFKTVAFNTLKKGDIFRFAGTKKVFEVSGRNRKDIDYFPHDNIWGDYRNTKKTTKRQVEINFEY